LGPSIHKKTSLHTTLPRHNSTHATHTPLYLPTPASSPSPTDSLKNTLLFLAYHMITQTQINTHYTKPLIRMTTCHPLSTPICQRKPLPKKPHPFLPTTFYPRYQNYHHCTSPAMVLVW
jgi:hypothetical protein